MKSTAILTVLMAGFCFSAATCLAQTANGQQKKEQNVKVVIREDPKTVQKGMTIMADSAYHQLGTDLKDKKVTVTVIDSGDGTGNSSTYSYTIGDSLQSKEGHKIVRSVGGKKMIIMKDGESEGFNVSAISPVVNGYRMIVDHPLHDSFAFDPGDTTIVSYKKKDMGKGLEKITIVRKKAIAVSK
ncbi:MAG: hypothetical protein WCP08_12235 [Prolixibacteraceae bacterium]